jgi:hypothetical protein
MTHPYPGWDELDRERNGPYSLRKNSLPKGTLEQVAEKLIFLKGTAFRPYVTALQ